MKAKYFERLIEGDFLEFKCAGIRHHLLRDEPEARGHLQEGEMVLLERDFKNIAGDKNAVVVLHDYDFGTPLGHVERDLRYHIAALVDAQGKVPAFINHIHDTYIDMCLPLDDKTCKILLNAQPIRTDLPESILPDYIIMEELPQERKVRLQADIVLEDTDLEQLVIDGRKYARDYGHSLSGEDEEKFAEIRWKIEDLTSRSTVNGQQSTELMEVYNSLMKKHIGMTHGDNVNVVYNEVEGMYLNEARLEGGLIERFRSKCMPEDEQEMYEMAKSVRKELRNYLNSIFPKTSYTGNKKNFALNIFYAALTNVQLREVMSHIVVYEYLTSVLKTKSSVNGLRSTVNEVGSGKETVKGNETEKPQDVGEALREIEPFITGLQIWYYPFRVLAEQGKYGYDRYTDFIKDLKNAGLKCKIPTKQNLSLIGSNYSKAIPITAYYNEEKPYRKPDYVSEPAHATGRLVVRKFQEILHKAH